MSCKFTDTNVSFGTWPWMDFSLTTPASLVAQLESEGIQQAWISASESILFPDPDIPDERLFSAFAAHPSVIPVKTLNPILGNWRESLELAMSAWGARLVKVYPNYHQYSLIDGPMTELAATLAARRIPLLIQMRVEDERNQYPLMKVPGVPAHEVATLAAIHPTLTIVVLSAYLSEIAAMTAGHRNVYADISFADSRDTMRHLLESTPADQLLFGSHAPFFYTRSAMMKLAAADLDGGVLKKIVSANAGRILVGC